MDIVCVTSRKLCVDNFLTQLEKIAAAKPKFIILREKDLTESEYTTLAADALEICRRHNVPLVCNTFFNAAAKIKADGIHLPLSIAEKGGCSKFRLFGISTHSIADAVRAQELGADYITYGHVFATDCKRGLAPRGTDALKAVCSAVDIPVYGIGGITPLNAADVINSGAKGVCLMSSLMQSKAPETLIKEFMK